MLLNKKWTWIVVIGILIATPELVKPNSRDTIDWLSYEKAQQVRQDRKFILYFNAGWCGFCRKLETTTFQDPDVVAFINRNFTPVTVNIDQEKQLAAQYGVRGVPDLRFVSAQGEPIARWSGFIESEDLMPLLKYIHTDSYLTQEYSQFLKDHS